MTCGNLCLLTIVPYSGNPHHPSTATNTTTVSDSSTSELQSGIKSLPAGWLHMNEIRGDVARAQCVYYTVKPVFNNHLYDKMYYLWFVQ